MPHPPPVFADHRAHLGRAIVSALAAADPYQAVARAVEREWGATHAARRTCVLIAAGKASVAMARAVIEVGRVQPIAGVIVSPPLPAGHRAPPAFVGGQIRLLEADHPLPTQRNLVAAQAVLDAARLARMKNLPLIVVLSGGASAHLTLPERGLTLADIRAVTDGLLKSGATIHEINTVRKHVEKLKGGRLAAASAPAPVQAFILSDVPGDSPAVIASGPTAADPTTFAEALSVLESRDLLSASPAITEHLKAGVLGKHAETPKPGNDREGKVRNTIVGSNALAVVAATEALSAMGFAVVDARFEIQGEACDVGRRLAEALIIARQTRTGPLALVWGGETTVRVNPAGHRHGGRNQELALAAAIHIADRPNLALATYATDGVDGIGPPHAPAVAGGLVTGRTVADALAKGIRIDSVLEASDSYRALASLNAHLGQGPTGTNVNDLAIALAY